MQFDHCLEYIEVMVYVSKESHVSFDEFMAHSGYSSRHCTAENTYSPILTPFLQNNDWEFLKWNSPNLTKLYQTYRKHGCFSYFYCFYFCCWILLLSMKGKFKARLTLVTVILLAEMRKSNSVKNKKNSVRHYGHFSYKNLLLSVFFRKNCFLYFYRKYRICFLTKLQIFKLKINCII